MTTLPTDIEIEALHRKYAPNDTAFELVYKHCLAVRDIALQLLDKYDGEVDREFVLAGCLLHDIGVYRLYDEVGNPEFSEYIRHGIEGEDLLRGEGFEERICRVGSHHTGVGLTANDVVQENLPLPAADYTAESIEERLIMYADKFHSKTTPPVLLTAAAYRRKVSKFGAGKAAKFDAMVAEFGLPDLKPLERNYGWSIED